MKTAIALCVAASAAFFTPAHAADVATLTMGGNTLTLQDKPCNAATAKRLKPEYADKFRNATETGSGQTFNACWIVTENGTIFVMYEDGEGGEVPMGLFKRPGENKPGRSA